MRGRVLSVDDATGSGSIVGEDGARYRFDRDSAASGIRVDEKDAVEFTAGWHHHVEPGSLVHATEFHSESRAPGGQLDMARTIHRTFDSIGQNWVVFLVAAGLLIGAPGLIGGLGLGGVVPTDLVGDLIAAAVSGLLSLVGGYVLQGIVVQASVNGFSRVRTGLLQTLRASAPALFPLVGASLVVGIATFLGYILLIVPGVMLSVIWIAVAPVIVVERRDIGASLQRSRDLTRGSRGQIFGLMVVFALAVLAISFLQDGVRRALVGTADGAMDLILPQALATIVDVATSLVAAAGMAAIYFELRTLKEGGATEQLAAIFD